MLLELLAIVSIYGWRNFWTRRIGLLLQGSLLSAILNLLCSIIAVLIRSNVRFRANFGSHLLLLGGHCIMQAIRIWKRQRVCLCLWLAVLGTLHQRLILLLFLLGLDGLLIGNSNNHTFGILLLVLLLSCHSRILLLWDLMLAWLVLLLLELELLLFLCDHLLVKHLLLLHWHLGDPWVLILLLI